MKRLIFILALFIGLSMQSCFVYRHPEGGEHHEGHEHHDEGRHEGERH